MDFSLSDEHKMVQDMARRFADQELLVRLTGEDKRDGNLVPDKLNEQGNKSEEQHTHRSPEYRRVFASEQ